jgi:hypothetical protein
MNQGKSMSEPTKEAPKPYVPQNRKGVSDWTSGGGANYLGLNDFGRFRFAFKKLRYVVGKDGKGSPYYAADCKVISCEPVAQPDQPEACEADASKKRKKYVPMPDADYQVILAALEKTAREGKYKSCWCDPTEKHAVGKIVTISFPVGSSPTAADPDKRDREDRVVGEIIRCILRKPRGAVVDFGILPELVAEPVLEHDNLIFDLDCIPSAKPNVIVDPATQDVLRTSIQVWPNRYYRSIEASAPAAA